MAKASNNRGLMVWLIEIQKVNFEQITRKANEVPDNFK
ncbi:hypothetical protein C900_02533 [Fulvivirga imtechensis AK7]|uniref:Uncharacterized protein n=1 Tax=Fulvivirga imtechensis AK7 TaxID=1237149 RepID=L8JRH5_9BACT|nr:hypothetical protein C900_02533 [Fulvivirga imtechensis AK7]